jgi:predicted lipid-binding transport protein (Tim44 family)
MECIEDIRSLLQGVIFAQSAGAYSLENSEQIAPIVRRILNNYPQLQGQIPGQIATKPVQPQVQKPTQKSVPKEAPDQTDELIKKIKAEPQIVNDSPSNIETQPRMRSQVNRSSIGLDEPDIEAIEAISLPIE